MQTLLLIGIGVNLVVAGLLFWLWLRLRNRYVALQSEAEALAQAAGSIPPELNELFTDRKRRLLVIEILNPLELAAKESWLAGQFGALSPELLNKVVYDKAAKLLGKQLPEFGVVADVQVHRVG